MKLSFKVNFPQKSIFGFEILSSFQSSISCYILLFLGRILNPLFGSNKIQIFAGSLFNIVLNTSILILIINLIQKRKEIQKISFFYFNLILFFYVPIALYYIVKYSILILLTLKGEAKLIINF